MPALEKLAEKRQTVRRKSVDMLLSTASYDTFGTWIFERPYFHNHSNYVDIPEQESSRSFNHASLQQEAHMDQRQDKPDL